MTVYGLILALGVIFGSALFPEEGASPVKSFPFARVRGSFVHLMAEVSPGTQQISRLAAQNSPARPEALFLNQQDDIYGKKDMRVAIIDSGLGGLSIMAEAADRLQKVKFYRQVNLVFFNSLFAREKGYNALPTREVRVEMFDKVLASLEKKVRPDLILIACNTLSTLYPSTRFGQKKVLPVLDIIQPGVNLISEQLKKQPDSVALILATPVTISEDMHRQQLLKQGFSPERLFVQACPELELFIEKDPEGEETSLLISGFLEEGLQQLSILWPPVIISLNCTHYGYSLPLWEKAAGESGLSSFTIVNPNSSLLDLWLKPGLRPRFEQTDVKAAVFSRVEIEEAARKNIASHLRKISAQVAEALLNYVLDPGLF